MNPTAKDQVKSAVTEIAVLLWPAVAFGLVALVVTTALSSVMFDESWLRAFTPVFVAVATMALITNVRLQQLTADSSQSGNGSGGDDGR